MFDQILTLIGQPPGSLVYHFLVLFAMEAALAMSFGQWMRDRDTSTGRLLLSTVVIFLARLFLLLASLFIWRGLATRDLLLPPVERLVDAATVIALMWTFVTMDDPRMLRRNFVPDVVSAAMLGLIVVAFVGTYYYWSASTGTFNNLWLDVAWSVTQIALALVGLIWMATRLRYIFDPVLKASMLLIFGAAAVWHLLDPLAGDVAAALRVAQIIIMPMLAAVSYRHVVEQLLHWDEFEPSRAAPLHYPVLRQAGQAEPTLAAAASRPAPVPDAAPVVQAAPAPAPIVRIPTPPPESIEEREEEGKSTVLAPEPFKAKPEVRQPQLLETVDALGRLMGVLSAGEIVREAPRAIATALRADVALLAIVDDSMEQAAIVGAYDNISQTFLNETVIQLSDHPTMVNSLGRLRQLRLTPQRNQKELADLFDSVGISHVGPAYLQPLINRNERIGLLIVGLPYSTRALSDDERNLLDRFGPLISSAMVAIQRHEDLLEDNERTLANESSRLVAASDELRARNAELAEAQRKMEEMKVYVRDAYRRLEEADRLRQEYEQLRQGATEGESLRQGVAEAQAELAAAREEAASARRRVRELEAEIERLRSAAGAVAQFDDNRIATQNEIAALRVRLAQAAINQQEISFLQEQLASKAREVISLQTRFMEAQAVAEALREQISIGIGSTRNLGALQNRIQDQTGEIERLRLELAMAQREASLGPGAQAIQQELDDRDRAVMSELEAQLSDRAALVESLEAQLSERSRSLELMKSRLAEIEPAMRDVEMQLRARDEQIAELQKTMTEARKQAEARIHTLTLEAEIGHGNATRMAEAQIEAMQAEIQEKSSAIEMMEAQLDSARGAMRELESRLASANEAVENAVAQGSSSDSHDEVIASIAQELRTPMSSIIGYTDVLLREQVGILGSLQRKFLQRVKANTERMGALLDDLVRVTALDRGRLQLEPEKVDIVYAIEETLTGLLNQFREKGLTLRMVFGENLPPVTADRDSIMQILSHLLSNAALASAVQGEVHLTVSSRRDRVPGKNGDEIETDCLYLSVEDSGPGIDEADIERVFVRKYRADNPLIEGLGDTGVGLSLTHTLITTHQGRIWLESSKGRGSTFHVLIPHMPPLAQAEPEA